MPSALAKEFKSEKEYDSRSSDIRSFGVQSVRSVLMCVLEFDFTCKWIWTLTSRRSFKFNLGMGLFAVRSQCVFNIFDSFHMVMFAEEIIFRLHCRSHPSVKRALRATVPFRGSLFALAHFRGARGQTSLPIEVCSCCVFAPEQ